jgi:hypothetical protein
MVRDNQASLGTAFTVSVEARHGVSTGISAKDRATTVRAAIADDARPHDLVSPGHVFPLRARKGGVLVRTGQTEGSVDLARLAGCKPAGVICEIMKRRRRDGADARARGVRRSARPGDLLGGRPHRLPARARAHRPSPPRARHAAGLPRAGRAVARLRLRHRGRGHRVPGAGARRPRGGQRDRAARCWCGWRCSIRSSIRWRSSPTSRSRCGDRRGRLRGVPVRLQPHPDQRRAGLRQAHRGRAAGRRALARGVERGAARLRPGRAGARRSRAASRSGCCPTATARSSASRASASRSWSGGVALASRAPRADRSASTAAAAPR